MTLVQNLRGGFVDRLLPNEWDYRGLSIRAILGLRLRIALEWAVQSTANWRRIRSRLALTRALPKAERCQPALVMGTGPSLLALDVDAVTEMIARGGAVFAVNFYCETTLAKVVRPQFYVLADPFFLEDWQSSERAEAVWKYILAEPAIPVVIPAHTNVGLLPSGIQTIYFNGLGLDGWTRNTSPLKPRAFSGITAYHAISMALFLDFDPVFTIGIDNDAFRTVSCDARGNIVLGGHHAYPDARSYATRPSPNPVASLLEDYARVMADLSLFDCSRLINLATPSLITSFRHGSLSAWLDGERRG